MRVLPAFEAIPAPRRVARCPFRRTPVRSGPVVEVGEAAVKPCVVAGLAVLAATVWRVLVEGAAVAVRMVRRVLGEGAEAAVRMVRRVLAEGAAVAVTRDGVEEEVAAPGSSRSGQAVAYPRQFIVRAATQLEAILMV